LIGIDQLVCLEHLKILQIGRYEYIKLIHPLQSLPHGRLCSSLNVALIHLEHAQQLLAHAEAATTRRIYRRRGQLVRPLK
jgi:hypothetical protein